MMDKMLAETKTTAELGDVLKELFVADVLSSFVLVRSIHQTYLIEATQLLQVHPSPGPVPRD